MTKTSNVDPEILHAWLRGRSLARRLPPPIAEYGGFRVDSHTDAEVSRWVFPKVDAGLRDLARSIREPRLLLKLCGSADELRAILPSGWEIHAPNYFMQANGDRFARSLPKGYTSELLRADAAIEVRIWSDSGSLAASGYGGETRAALVYDRIVTAPDHRRRGLGHVVMATLQAARQNTGGPELLVATEEGRALYTKLGWRTISPYATASFVAL